MYKQTINVGVVNKRETYDIGYIQNQSNQLTVLKCKFLDAIEYYVTRKDFNTAFDIATSQRERGPTIFFARAMVQNYVCSMHANKPEIAVGIREELIQLLNSNAETNGVDAEHYGNWCRKNGKLFEAFLFYQIALEFHRNGNDTLETVISSLFCCCSGTSEIINKLVKDSSTSNQLIESYMISFMRKIVAHIGNHAAAENESYSYKQCICLHYIEQCELEVKDYVSRENTLNEELDLFHSKLGPNPEKHNLYGGCLNNLGHNYLLQNKVKEAAKCFARAIVAKQKAEDYDTKEEKQKDVEISELGLEAARNQG